MKISLYNRRKFLKQLGLAATFSTIKFAPTLKAENVKKPNVLFISIDDLRPELGCYGRKQIISPNIDQLASEGILFDNAYCQQPICMASRASLLSGYRPDYADIYNCQSIEKLAPAAVTMNKHFENNGYQIWATGKIYHYREDHIAQFGNNWVNPEGDWIGRGYLSPEARKQVNEYKKVYAELRGGDSSGRGPAFEAPDVADNAYSDGKKTELAIRQLQNFSKSDKPFFLAVGFNKPHLPFNAPKKYWEMYDPNKIELADNPHLPENATRFTPYNFGELRNYYGIPKDDKIFSADLSRKLIRGYFACVTYIDAQIGKLMSEVDRLNLRDNTVIVLWGDHGWKLGEHGMWCKHTPFELDAKVPLIFNVPGLEHKGRRAKSFAEFVDIYPTLCDLCKLEKPPHLEGSSLLPALNNPDLKLKSAAFTQWPKVSRGNPDKVITAYSIKTAKFRYIEWTHNKSGQILAGELYDHQTDPDENKNIAQTEKYRDVVNNLSRKLNGGKGWKALHSLN